MTNIFDKANAYIRDTESSLVNLLSAIAPWGAPLAPAAMSYAGMKQHLGFSEPIAVIIAGVIEILGLATVHTTLSFWQHNRRYSREYRRMPTRLAGGMFCLYLIVILTVNVLMEAFVSWPGMPILARALLSLLSVPAAVTMAIRAQHTELLREIQGKKGGKIGERKTKEKAKENFPAKENLSDWRTLPEEDKRLIVAMTTPEIRKAYQVSYRTAQNWRKWAEKDGKS